MQLKRAQSGDTIVAVLVSIMVLSVVLSGAFVSSSRSLNATIQTRERDQAVRLLETQLERLQAASVANGAVFDVHGPFCLDANLAVRQPAPCALDSANQNWTSASPSIPFHISVTRGGTTAAPVFTAEARWERAGGGGDLWQRASLIYRTYPW